METGRRAQPHAMTVDRLLARLAALEREREALRAELRRLRAGAGGGPAGRGGPAPAGTAGGQRMADRKSLREMADELARTQLLTLDEHLRAREARRFQLMRDEIASVDRMLRDADRGASDPNVATLVQAVERLTRLVERLAEPLPEEPWPPATEP
jgi:hypothetical protein